MTVVAQPLLLRAWHEHRLARPARAFSKILVDDLSLDGTESGIRIKSNPTRGGLVDGCDVPGCVHPRLQPSYSAGDGL